MGLEVEGVWNGIITVTAPGMTAEDTSDGEVEPLNGAVLLDGLHCIL